MKGYQSATPITPAGTNLQLTGQPLKDWLVAESIRRRGEKDEYGSLRGCAVGYTLYGLGGEDDILDDIEDTELDDYSAYQQIGIPEWAAMFQDSMFWRLTDAEQVTWPERFFEAIPVGLDWQRARHKFAIYLMENEAHFDAEKYPQVAQARATVANLHRKALVGNDVSSSDWRNALIGVSNAAKGAAKIAALSSALSASLSADWNAVSHASLSAGLCAVKSAASNAVKGAALSAVKGAASNAARIADWSVAQSVECAAITRISEQFLEICRTEANA